LFSIVGNAITGAFETVERWRGQLATKYLYLFLGCFAFTAPLERFRPYNFWPFATFKRVGSPQHRPMVVISTGILGLSNLNLFADFQLW
jgi:hypothetical protein